jgi:hypothetical protein
MLVEIISTEKGNYILHEILSILLSQKHPCVCARVFCCVKRFETKVQLLGDYSDSVISFQTNNIRRKITKQSGRLIISLFD